MISLFSGAGGLDLGLEMAGFETRVATDLEPRAVESLALNQALSSAVGDDKRRAVESVLRRREFSRLGGEAIESLRVRLNTSSAPVLSETRLIRADIRELSGESLLEAAHAKRGEIDLLAGGPPCQSFSRAGQRATVMDERGLLFLDFVRVVRAVMPRWVVFENVKGLGQTKAPVRLSTCTNCQFIRHSAPAQPELESCPRCSSSLIHGLEPSRRGGALEIVLSALSEAGYECSWALLDAADYGVPQYRERLIVVASRDHEPYAFPGPTHGADPQKLQASLWPASANGHRTVWEELFSRPNHYHSREVDQQSSVLWVKNVVRPHDEPVTWTLDRPSPTIGAHQGAKLAIAPKGVPPEQLLRQQWHVLGRRQGDTRPVPVEHTYLSDEDLLTLQSFPRNWFLAGTRMERAFQIGNAVPPLLAQAIGSSLLGENRAKRSGGLGVVPQTWPTPRPVPQQAGLNAELALEAV